MYAKVVCIKTMAKKKNLLATTKNKDKKKKRLEGGKKKISLGIRKVLRYFFPALYSVAAMRKAFVCDISLLCLQFEDYLFKSSILATPFFRLHSARLVYPLVYIVDRF